MCRLIKGALVVCLLVFWAPSFFNQKISSTTTFSKVEEKVIGLQESKKDLIDSVIDGNLENSSILKNLSEDNLIDLFM